MAQIMTKGKRGKGIAGCYFYNDCFTCPYKDCILDTGIQKVSLARKKRTIELNNSGMWPKEIAVVLGLSKRQIERYLKK